MESTRLERLRSELRRSQIHCAVVVPGPNLRYLTGLHMKPSERITLAFLPVEAEPALLLPLLERPHVENQLKINSRLYSYRDEEGPDAAFAQITRELALEKKTLGVELLQMRVLELRRIETHALGCRITGLEEGLAQLRMIKDESEIDSLRKAVALTEKTLQKTIDAIRPGMSEREIASVYQLELLKSGGDEISFTPLVVSGPNTGSPHASPGERVVQQGDLVTLDCGARWNGYAGDITRSVALGTVDPELERIYEIVQAANEAGRKACKPGIAAQEVDRAARRVIEEAGYGKYFIHRTGHGLGLEVHEPPYILEGNRQELQPGMTFTVEPGIYLPGKGGVRIEDNMLITSRGAETLTSFPRELIHL